MGWHRYRHNYKVIKMFIFPIKYYSCFDSKIFESLFSNSRIDPLLKVMVFLRPAYDKIDCNFFVVLAHLNESDYLRTSLRGILICCFRLLSRNYSLPRIWKAGPFILDGFWQKWRGHVWYCMKFADWQ